MATIRLATKGCPGRDCTKQGQTRIIYWNHGKCDNKSFLDRFAKVHCFHCDTSYSLLESEFKCKFCKNYSSAKPERLGRILAALSTMEFDDVREIAGSFNQEDFSNFLDDVVDNLK